VLPVFKRLEDWQGGADRWRGAGGRLAVQDQRGRTHPVCDAFFAAAAEAGLLVGQDSNSAEMEGATAYQVNIRGGVRASTARCYLRPAMRRGNVEVLTRAHVTRLLFEGERVAGVEFRRGGATGAETRTARARAEVILAGGAINSPQLLQLSGIGATEVLRPLGIEIQREAPAVGRHLQDHLGLEILYRARVPTLHQVLGPWPGRLRVGLQYLLLRSGPLAMSINHAGGFARTRPELKRPDAQLYFQPLSYTGAPVGSRPLMCPDPFPGFQLGVSPCRPTARGPTGDPGPCPRHRLDRVPPLLQLPDGHRSEPIGGRPAAAGAWRGGLARGRRLGVSLRDQRQHQCADDHGGGAGGGNDPGGCAVRIVKIERFANRYAGFVRVTDAEGRQGWGQVLTYHSDIAA